MELDERIFLTVNMGWTDGRSVTLRFDMVLKLGSCLMALCHKLQCATVSCKLRLEQAWHVKNRRLSLSRCFKLLDFILAVETERFKYGA